MGLIVKCKNKENEEYIPDIFYGEDLTNLYDIEYSEKLEEYQNIKINLAVDVTNPLIGENGSVYTFAKQKGATDDQLKELEKGMTKLSEILENKFKINPNEIVGSGATGGIPATFSIILKSKIKSGIELISNYLNLEENISNYDLIFTGEGCYDHQSDKGKVVSHVKYLCKKYNKKLIIVCGKNEIGKVDNEVVIDLLSNFSLKESFEDTKNCIKKSIIKYFF